MTPSPPPIFVHGFGACIINPGRRDAAFSSHLSWPPRVHSIIVPRRPPSVLWTPPTGFTGRGPSLPKTCVLRRGVCSTSLAMPPSPGLACIILSLFVARNQGQVSPPPASPPPMPPMPITCSACPSRTFWYFSGGASPTSMGTLSARACASACASSSTCDAWLINPANGACSHWAIATGHAITASCFPGNPGSYYGAVEAAVAPTLTSSEICTTSAWSFCAACPTTTVSHAAAQTLD